MPEFDFNAIEVAAEPVPAIVRPTGSGRAAEYENNPFSAPILDSWITGQGDREKGGRYVIVPKAQVKKAQYLIRRAAAGQELGAGITLTLPNSKEKLTAEEFDSFGDGKHIKVRFYAKQKRQYTKGEETPETEETVSE